MGRKVIAFWLSLAMVLSFIVVLDVIIDFTPPVKGGIIRYVNETGTGGAYTKIQDAINASDDGDTVFVYNGTYYENVLVNKTINLTGEDRDTTIIDGSGSGDVVTITVDWVNVSFITITNGSTGIYLSSSSYDDLSDNTVSINSNDGISLDFLSDYNDIRFNIITNNGNGIMLSESSHNTISDNAVVDNDWDGIYLFFNSNYNNVQFNIIENHNNSGVKILESDNNYITQNFNIEYNDHGIYLWDAHNNDISMNDYIHNNTYGIYLEFSNSNTIEPLNDIYDNDYGIYMLSSIDNTIVDNSIKSNNRYGIHLHYSSNITISSNNVSRNNDYGIFIDYSEENLITNNEMHGNLMAGLYVNGNHKPDFNHTIDTSNTINGKSLYYFFDLHDITIENLDTAHITLAYCDNVTLKNSNVTFGDFLHLVSTTNSKIDGCNVSNNIYYGILIRFLFTTNNVITNCTILYNQWGIFSYVTQYNTIMNNIISFNNQYGIYFSSSSWNNITGNYIFNNNQGIDLTSSSNNLINNNKIEGNWRGIYLRSSSKDNNVSGNNVLNNDGGFYIWASSNNNSFYHNNILWNSFQAYDDGMNKWDNGYPSGGNFWSDYTGVDLNSTPTQDVPPPDGIGDTNYSIDSDSIDNYPLMDPFGNHILLYQAWNLVSIPFIQSDVNLDSVLSSITGSYDAAQWYNVSDYSNPWKNHHISKPSNLNDLGIISHTMGFWIHITEPRGILFEYLGTQPASNQTIPLYPGWNQVGYPSLTSYNRTEGLNNLTFGTHVDAIWTYNAATQKWKELGPSDYFEIGRGYWVHAKVKCEWEVPL